MTRLPIYLALDGNNLEAMLRIVGEVGSRVEGAKIHRLYDRMGPKAVEELKKLGIQKVGVDLKLLDIASTMKGRAAELRDAGADFITVHAQGVDHMFAAKDGAGKNVIVLGVTVLTDLDPAEAEIIGGMSIEAQVLQRARDARLAELDGFVCPTTQLASLAKRRELIGMKRLAPGSRLPGSETHEQKHVVEPGAAMKGGAWMLVVGRELVESENPNFVLDRIEGNIRDHQG